MQNTDHTAAPRAGEPKGEASTHFGFRSVPEREKAGKVAEVFHSVAGRYDLMNDLMSAGLHRVWKAFTIGRADVRPGMKVLDIAGGTGDLARAFAKRRGPPARSGLQTSTIPCLRSGATASPTAAWWCRGCVRCRNTTLPTGYFDG